MDRLSFPTDFDAGKAMHLPLGAASPLWFAFAGVAAMGAAYYWMNRWREATNLEAMMALPMQTLAVPEIAEPALEPVAEIFAALAPEPVAEPEPVIEAAPEPVVEAAPEPEPEVVLEPNDLTRLVGIGPKLAATLAHRGVTRFEHIAAWTAEDISETDKALKLLGRIERDAWVAQAKRFAAEA